MRDGYYDKNCNRISYERFCELYEDDNYKYLAETKLEELWVSTVWLGMDHSFWDGEPLIFESMVFRRHSFEDVDCIRTSTIEDALTAHHRLVKKWSKRNELA